MPQLNYNKYDTEFLEEILTAVKKVKLIIDSLIRTLENLKRTLNPQNSHKLRRHP